MSMIKVRSEITGSVWKIRVAEGDAIAEGDVAVVLEI